MVASHEHSGLPVGLDERLNVKFRLKPADLPPLLDLGDFSLKSCAFVERHGYDEMVVVGEKEGT